jgi:hypothetical protein
MNHTALGRTGLRVAGLGTGGFNSISSGRQFCLMPHATALRRAFADSRSR